MECILSSHSKSSCSRCSSNNLKCVFPPSVRNMPHDKDHVQFSRNCVFCTQSHRQCRFAGPQSTKCSRCIEYRVPCFFTISGEFHSYSYTIAPLCMCPHILSVLYYSSFMSNERLVTACLSSFLSKITPPYMAMIVPLGRFLVATIPRFFPAILTIVQESTLTCSLAPHVAVILVMSPDNITP